MSPIKFLYYFLSTNCPIIFSTCMHPSRSYSCMQITSHLTVDTDNVTNHGSFGLIVSSIQFLNYKGQSILCFVRVFVNLKNTLNVSITVDVTCFAWTNYITFGHSYCSIHQILCANIIIIPKKVNCLVTNGIGLMLIFLETVKQVLHT